MDIIGLMGYAQVGKDTGAEAILSLGGYQSHAFADALRDMAKRLNPLLVPMTEEGHMALRGPASYNFVLEALGYEWAKEHTDARKFLVSLGAGAREIIGPNVWVNAGFSVAENAPEGVVFADVRYPNEALGILERGGLVIYVSREGVGPENEEERDSVRDALAATRGHPRRVTIHNQDKAAYKAEVREIVRLANLY